MVLVDCCAGLRPDVGRVARCARGGRSESYRRRATHLAEGHPSSLHRAQTPTQILRGDVPLPSRRSYMYLLRKQSCMHGRIDDMTLPATLPYRGFLPPTRSFGTGGDSVIRHVAGSCYHRTRLFCRSVSLLRSGNLSPGLFGELFVCHVEMPTLSLIQLRRRALLDT